MYLPMLNDKELIAHARAVDRGLTTSDLERELASRLEARIDEAENDKAMRAVLADHGVDGLEELTDYFKKVDAVRSAVDDL